MLCYDSVYHAPTDKMKTNVDEWTEMIGKLAWSRETLFAGEVAQPLKTSGWSGGAAKKAIAFVTETGKELDDAVKEAPESAASLPRRCGHRIVIRLSQRHPCSATRYLGTKNKRRRSKNCNFGLTERW